MNKLIKIAITVFLFLGISVYAQPVTEWISRYNGLLDSTDAANDIAIDNSGNTYITGYSLNLLGLLRGAVTISYDPAGNQRWRSEYDQLLNDEGSAVTLDNTGQYVYVTGYTNGLLNLTGADYLIIKYRSSDGQQIWAKTYSSSLLSDDRATSIVMDSQNNPVITGYSQGFLIVLTPYDYATVKYDPNGNQLWSARYNGSGNNDDKAWGIAVDDSDNVFVTGQSSGSGTGYDYATVKYSPAGVQQWEQRYNGPANSDDKAWGIAVDDGNNAVVTGQSTGASSGDDYATVKYSPSGTQQWAGRYNGPGNNEDRAYAIIVDNSDNVIVTGSSRSGSTSETEDYATIKYSPAGTQMWAGRYNGPGNNEDRAYAIVVDNSDNIFVTGSSRSTSSTGSEDYATLVYTPSGTQLWDIRYNGTGNNEDRAYAIVVDNFDNVYITGSSRNGALAGSEDYLTIKYSGLKLAISPPLIDQLPSEFSFYQNYPNPFNPVTLITFDIPVESYVNLSIYNTAGSLVKILADRGYFPGRHHINFDASLFTSGIYFCKLEAVPVSGRFNIFRDTRKLILVK